MTSNEHKLARALVAAHTAPEVAEVVLDAVDAWAAVVAEAQEAIEQHQRTVDDLNRFYTIKELMLLLRKSESSVRAMIADGTLAVTRIGDGRHSLRVPIADVERYLSEHTSRQETTGKPRAPRRARTTPAEEDVMRRWPGIVD